MKANVNMKNQWRLVVGIILILVIVIFAILNIEVVPINFGFTQLNRPLIIIIFIHYFRVITYITISNWFCIKAKERIETIEKTTL